MRELLRTVCNLEKKARRESKLLKKEQGRCARTDILQGREHAYWVVSVLISDKLLDKKYD